MSPVPDDNFKNNGKINVSNSYIGKLSSDLISEPFDRDLADTGHITWVVEEISYSCPRAPSQLAAENVFSSQLPMLDWIPVHKVPSW